jgi:hypothetical protein
MVMFFLRSQVENFEKFTNAAAPQLVRWAIQIIKSSSLEKPGVVVTWVVVHMFVVSPCIRPLTRTVVVKVAPWVCTLFPLGANLQRVARLETFARPPASSSFAAARRG